MNSSIALMEDSDGLSVGALVAKESISKGTVIQCRHLRSRMRPIYEFMIPPDHSYWIVDSISFAALNINQGQQLIWSYNMGEADCAANLISSG